MSKNMSETLKTKLLESPFELTEQQIEGMIGIGISEESDFTYVEKQDLINAGLSVVQAGKLLTSFKSVSNQQEEKFVYVEKPGEKTLKQLLEDYNVKEVIDNSVIKDLKEKLGNLAEKPIIAFKPSSEQVAVEETLEYIRDLKNTPNLPPRTHVDGQLVKLFKIGEPPTQEKLPEDPMIPGSFLRQNRSVTYPDCNYENIDKKTQQLIRIIINRGESNPANIAERSLIMSKAQENFKTLAEMFPNSFLDFEEKEKADRLPKL